MLAEDPVIRFRGSNHNNPIVNLKTGNRLESVDGRLAEKIIAVSPAINSFEKKYELVEKDQWTITRFYESHRPFYKFSEAGTRAESDSSQWYVSSSTGQIFQQTTAKQRFWNYLGAVPHWLYPTVLSKSDDVWEMTVIIIYRHGIF